MRLRTYGKAVTVGQPGRALGGVRLRDKSVRVRANSRRIVRGADTAARRCAVRRGLWTDTARPLHDLLIRGFDLGAGDKREAIEAMREPRRRPHVAECRAQSNPCQQYE